jgi:nitrogenase subunit NifH
VENGPSNILKALNQKKAEGLNPLGMLAAPRERKDDREKESENFLSEELKAPVNQSQSSLVNQPLLQQQTYNQYFSVQGQQPTVAQNKYNYIHQTAQELEQQKCLTPLQEQQVKPLQQNQNVKQQQTPQQTFWAGNDTWKGTKTACFPPSSDFAILI